MGADISAWTKGLCITQAKTLTAVFARQVLHPIPLRPPRKFEPNNLGSTDERLFRLARWSDGSTPPWLSHVAPAGYAAADRAARPTSPIAMSVYSAKVYGGGRLRVRSWTNELFRRKTPVSTRDTPPLANRIISAEAHKTCHLERS